MTHDDRDRRHTMADDIRAKFVSLSPKASTVCLALRELAFDVASEDERIGPIVETLKWGVPSYLTQSSKSGSTLRIWQTKEDQQPALFVHCQTKLINRFQDIYRTEFEYRDNRALVLDPTILDDSDALEKLRHCIALTFTYHLWK